MMPMWLFSQISLSDPSAPLKITNDMSNSSINVSTDCWGMKGRVVVCSAPTTVTVFQQQQGQVCVCQCVIFPPRGSAEAPQWRRQELKCVTRRPLTLTNIWVPVEPSSPALWHSAVMACQHTPTVNHQPGDASVVFMLSGPPPLQQTLTQPWNAACLQTHQSGLDIELLPNRTSFTE